MDTGKVTAVEKVTWTLPRELVQRVRQAAEAEDRSAASIVRRALRQMFAQGSATDKV